MVNKLQFVPLACAILFPVTFIITYSMAVSYDHIWPVWAYISDTGTTPPESCWFGLFLSLTAIALGSVVYIRYKQIEAFYNGSNSTWMEWINIIGMFIGMIASLGVILVGAFQETNVIVAHLVGAFMSFLGGGFYLCIQAFFTFKMLPMFTNKTIAILRAIIGPSVLILFVLTITCGFMAFEYGNGYRGANRMKWDKDLEDEINYRLRATSVTCEWVMAALLDVFILSFMLDFRQISFKAPQFKLIEMVTIGKNNGNFVQIRYKETNMDKA